MIVVTVLPAIAVPWNTTAYSGPFGAIRASTSPAGPGRRQPSSQRPDRALQLAVGHHPPGHPVDQRRGVRPAGPAGQHVLGEREIGDLHVGQRAVMDHRSSLTGDPGTPTGMPQLSALHRARARAVALPAAGGASGQWAVLQVPAEGGRDAQDERERLVGQPQAVRVPAQLPVVRPTRCAIVRSSPASRIGRVTPGAAGVRAGCRAAHHNNDGAASFIDLWPERKLETLLVELLPATSSDERVIWHARRATTPSGMPTGASRPRMHGSRSSTCTHNSGLTSY